jgi:hypothetical protein
MPNYARPFGAAGGAAGAAGGSLLGALGRLLSPLDYPRQALYNLFSGVGEGIDQGDWHPALKAIPGALGTALAGGLMATGVGAPLGILAGSALGGASQGLFGSDAPTSDDLAQKLGIDTESTGGKIASFGLGMATDPLSYAGGLGGALKGAKAGRSLEEAAQGAHLGYGGGVGKLEDILRPLGQRLPEKEGMISGLLNSPHAATIAGEIPEGSTYLGHGAEAIALKTPEGHVIRIAPGGDSPLNVPEILQPARNVTAGPYRVTHTPLVETLAPYEGVRSEVHDLSRAARSPEDVAMMRQVRGELSGTNDVFERASQQLDDRLVRAGLDPADVNPGNIGSTAPGRWVVHDPGAVFPDSITPVRAASTTLSDPGRVQSALLTLLGQRRGLRRELADRLGNVASQGVELPGLQMPATSLVRQLMMGGA